MMIGILTTVPYTLPIICAQLQAKLKQHQKEMHVKMNKINENNRNENIE